MAIETLAGGETGKGRGVGAGGSNELNAARNAQSKSFFLILDLLGASCGGLYSLPNYIFCSLYEKRNL